MRNERDDFDNIVLPTNDGKTLEEIISGVAEQEFAELPPAVMSPEKLEMMAAKRRASEQDNASDKYRRDKFSKAGKRRESGKRSAMKIAGLAAMIVLVLIGVFAVGFNALSVDVGADKNKKEEIKTNDGVVIEDGGYGASSEDGVWVVTDWDEIKLLERDTNHQIIIPEYVPEEYKFVELIIECLETGEVVYEYLFLDTKDENKFFEIKIFNLELMLESLDISEVSKIIECEKGSIHIQDMETKIATFQAEDGMNIYVLGNIPDEDIVKIIEGLNY